MKKIITVPLGDQQSALSKQIQPTFIGESKGITAFNHWDVELLQHRVPDSFQ